MSTTKLFACILLGSVICGCTGGASVAAENPGGIQGSGSSGRVNEEESGELTKEEARAKAAQFVAGKNWGEPTSVGDFGRDYIVFFETPRKENMLVGQRAVLVNKKTGSVEFQRRR